MKRLKNISAAFLLIVFSTIVGIGLLEMAVRVYFHDTNSIEDYKRLNNYYLLFGMPVHATGCHWQDGHYSHPYLGFVTHNIQDKCGTPVNNLLAYGDDLPEAKDPNHYVILLLGGSVSQQISGPWYPHRKNWIADYLNEHYVSPNGKPFLVATGAVGAWKHPNQLHQLLMTLRRFDAFISIEGYNEVETIPENKFFAPMFPYYMVADLPDLSISEIETTKYFRRVIDSSKYLRESYLTTVVFIKLKSILGENFLQNRGRSIARGHWELSHKIEPSERISNSIGVYETQIRQLDAITTKYEVPGVIFLQPIARYRKILTENEKLSAPESKSEKIYPQIELMLETLKLKSLKIVNLTGLYEDNTETIYSDNVHPVFSEQKVPSRSPRQLYNKGYDLMSKAIADKIADLWDLKKK